MFSSTIMNLMMELITLSFVVPVVLIAVWKMRCRTSLVPVFAGAGAYLLFAVVFKSVPDMLFLPLAGKNIWLQGLYSAVVTALLEVCGAYVFFRYFLSKYQNREAAVSYGLGYACLDCIAVLGIRNMQNYAFAQMLERNPLDTLLESVSSNPALVASYQALAEELQNMGSIELILSGVMQLVLLFLQTALAVLIFYAVHKAGQMRYLWIALVMQALVSFLPVFYQVALVPGIVVVLGMVILTVGVVQLAFRLYQSLSGQEKAVIENQSRAGWDFAGKKLSAKQKEDSHE